MTRYKIICVSCIFFVVLFLLLYKFRYFPLLFINNSPNNTSNSCNIDHSWPLTFDEEFNETSINWHKWKDGGQNFITGPGAHKEQETYIKNAYKLTKGMLRIRANKRKAHNNRSNNQNVHKQPYTSGMLDTFGTFQQTYGYFEARAKLPEGKGLWPAFWLYNAQGHTPYEIDIMENLGDQANIYYMTYHSPAGKSQKTYKGVDLTNKFHTYAVKWTPGLIVFCFDGVEQFRSTHNISSKPMAIILNLAVGGTWPGSPNSSTHFPSYLDIDYVHAYAMPS